MKKLSINVVAEISIFAAIGFILDLIGEMIPSPAFSAGGSISIAMVAIFVIGYRRGVAPAVLVGLLIGLLDMSAKLYVISSTWYNMFLQISLDYVICYAIVGVGVIFFSFAKKSTTKSKYAWITLGVFTGSLLKYASHWFSGVLFFGTFAPDGVSKYLYTTYYNAGYMIPCFILTLAVMVIIAAKYEHQLLIPTDQIKLHAKGDTNEKI